MPIKFGEVMGRAFPHVRGGCPFYSSHYESADDNEDYTVSYKLSTGQIIRGLGYSHQCVGGARCGLVHLFDTSFPSVGMAYTIFELPYFEKLTAIGGNKLSVERVPTIKCKNGAAPEDPDSLALGVSRPRAGMLLIWHSGGFFRGTGHVAIVTDVVEKGQRQYGVRIAEANYDDERWVHGHYSRELPAIVNDKGHFEIFEPHPEGGRIKGWIGSINMLHFEDPTSPSFAQTAGSMRARRSFAEAVPALDEKQQGQQQAHQSDGAEQQQQ